MRTKDFENLIFTLEEDFSDIEIANMMKDAELYELPQDVKHIQHDKTFEEYCGRNIVSEEWYRLYLSVMDKVENCVLDKEYTEKDYYRIKQDFDDMVRMYNSLFENQFIDDDFVEDVRHITSGIWQIMNYMEAKLCIEGCDHDKPFSDSVIQYVIDSIQTYEENELAFHYGD